MKDNLIARQKEEKITLLVSAGIIAIMHNLISTHTVEDINLFWYSIPFFSSILTLIFDWCSNVKFYTEVEKDENVEVTGTKWFNRGKTIFFGISVISFCAVYLINLI